MTLRIAATAAILLLSACAHRDAEPAAATGPAPTKVTGVNGVQGEITGTIVPGSRFSRLQIGMSAREAESLVGPPTDTADHITGKQFIPFYFGGDMSREETFYRGEGQLTYTHPSIGSSALVLIGIRADPTERGFAH